MRVHILGLAHTVSTPAYSQCAFTQKVVKICRMLTRAGHEVFHYGHAQSEVEAQNIYCVGTVDHDDAYPGWDWRTQGFPPFKVDDLAYRVFNSFAISEIGERKQPGDFLLVPFGYAQQPVADAHKDMLVVESGIGYGGGMFAPYKVFESYALMHAYRGLDAVCHASNEHWYDVVIPNYYDPTEFTYEWTKQDYLLHMGRLGVGKGTHIAIDLARKTGHTLVVAGPLGDYKLPPDVEYAGVVGPRERAKLLTNAKALLCPSTYVEPFCGVMVEAFLSGTPVISTDFGAFVEYNIHGHTGYRCRTFGDFMRAVENIGQIRSDDCHRQGMTFSLDSVWPQYERYFQDIQNVYSGAGWYSTSGR
jgi:glycosyltransferase involved in cell wall biosynthesis